MRFGPERELDTINPFKDEHDGPAEGDFYSESLEELRHRFEIDFAHYLESNPLEPHLAKIDVAELIEEDYRMWFKFQETLAGNLILNPDSIAAYKENVFAKPNPSRNNLSGLISNRLLVYFIQNKLITEKLT